MLLGCTAASGGGPAPPPYTANAVSWIRGETHGVDYFAFDNFDIPNSSTGLFSHWIYLEADQSYATGILDDISPDFLGNFFFSSNSAFGDMYGSYQFWEASTSGSHFTIGFEIDGPLLPGWHHLLVSIDTNHPAGAKIGNISFDGAPITPSFVVDGDPAFEVTWSEHPTFIVTGSPNNTHDHYYIAENYGAMGQYADAHAPAVIAKFRTAGGKPVYLGANGELPTGSPATYLFTGTAEAFVNSGTAGTVTESGDPATFSNAPSSPSD